MAQTKYIFPKFYFSEKEVYLSNKHRKTQKQT